MAVTFAPHVRVSALGRIGAASNGEIFSYGFCFAPDNGVVTLGQFQGVTALQWTDLADSVRDFHARAATRISELAVLERVKIAAIGVQGQYLEKPPIERTYNTPGGQTDDGHFLPQAALAITLDTATVSQSGRGRFFIPIPVVSLGIEVTGDFHIVAAQATGIRDSAQTMINDVNNFPGIDQFTGGGRVVVASSLGVNREVTSVRVGRIVDTMRSRRNKLSESYTASVGIS